MTGEEDVGWAGQAVRVGGREKETWKSSTKQDMIEREIMKHLNMALFPCVLVTVLATFLLRPVVAQAVTPGACGSWSIVPSPNVPSRSNSLTAVAAVSANNVWRSEEHTSELQSLRHIVCRLLLEK